MSVVLGSGHSGIRIGIPLPFIKLRFVDIANLFGDKGHGGHGGGFHGGISIGGGHGGFGLDFGGGHHGGHHGW